MVWASSRLLEDCVEGQALSLPFVFPSTLCSFLFKVRSQSPSNCTHFPRKARFSGRPRRPPKCSAFLGAADHLEGMLGKAGVVIRTQETCKWGLLPQQRKIKGR